LFVVLVLSLPIKILLLRLVFRVKYVWVTPGQYIRRGSTDDEPEIKDARVGLYAPVASAGFGASANWSPLE